MIRTRHARFMELIIYRSLGALNAESTRTWLSYLWWIFEPILMMFVYYIVFGVIFKSSIENFIPFLMIGLITWNWFAHTFLNSSGAIIEGGGLMMQVNVHKLIFPFVAITIDLVKALIVFAVLITYLIVAGFWPNVNWLFLPIIMLSQFIFIVGASTLFSGMAPFLPDLRIGIQPVLQAIFFGSGIFFLPTDVPEGIRGMFWVNPMARIIVDYRNVFLYNQNPNYKTLIYITVVGLILFAMGICLIQIKNQVYPRIVD